MNSEKSILFLPKQKMVFLLSAKCAGSSVRRMAIHDLGYMKENHPNLGLEYLQPEEVGQYKGYRKVMVARNPYSRFVSLYEDKVVRCLRPQFGIFGIARDCSFREFVHAVSNIPDSLADSHMWAQTLFYDFVKPDIIIKLENIDKEWEQLHLPTLKYWNATEYEREYQDYYDSELEGLVRKRYERDFQVLNYEMCLQ